MIRLTERQALSVHEMMIKATGGSGGVRDAGLLNSSLNAPFQSFGNKDIFHRCCLKRRHCAARLFATTRLLTEISGQKFTLC